MKWYKNLYLGENARKEKYKIIVRSRHAQWQPDVHLIILSDNPDNLLEILPAIQLKLPQYRLDDVQDRICVVGIARGYEEALDVSAGIIADVYNNTRGFNIREYLQFGMNL